MIAGASCPTCRGGLTRKPDDPVIVCHGCGAEYPDAFLPSFTARPNQVSMSLTVMSNAAASELNWLLFTLLTSFQRVDVDGTINPAKPIDEFLAAYNAFMKEHGLIHGYSIKTDRNEAKLPAKVKA